ncbi:hypothetical protein HK096_000076, partial [Nowakowskiella sp. JEL0078]
MKSQDSEFISAPAPQQNSVPFSASQDNQFISVPAFQQFSVPSQTNTSIVPSYTSKDNQFISVPAPQPYSVPSHLQTNTSIIPSSTSKDNEFVSAPAPKQYSVPSHPQINTSIVPSSTSSQTLQSPPSYAPASSEIHYAGYTPYNQPGYVQPARLIDPELQGAYPPTNYAAPVQEIQVTLAQHKASFQAGY